MSCWTPTIWPDSPIWRRRRMRRLSSEQLQVETRVLILRLQHGGTIEPPIQMADLWPKSNGDLHRGLARLLLSVFDPEALLENIIPIPSNPYLPRYADVGELAEEYGFHKAILYLAGGPSWRMKECKNDNCGRRFVADHNERKCCSTRCSSEYQAERQKKWGRKNNWGRPGPVKAKTRKGRPRLLVSRPKKAAAKT